MSNVDPLAPSEPLDWKMYAVSDDLSGQSVFRRLGEIDEFTKATFILRLNDVGSFTIDSDPQATGIMAAINPEIPTNEIGGGLVAANIELVIDGRTVFLGPIQGVERRMDPYRESITVFGKDQNAWLAHRVVQPRIPIERAPYPFSFATPKIWEDTNTRPSCGAYQYSAAERQGYDVFTGPANQAMAHYVFYNLGPGSGNFAGMARRKLTFVEPTNALGAVVTASGRWQNLLELVQGIAIQAGEWPLSFTCVPWTFTVRQPTDRGAYFSPGLGNVKSFIARNVADDLNFAYVAGQGEAEQRQVATMAGYGRTPNGPGGGVGYWPPVYPNLPDHPWFGLVEGFRDRRDTDDWDTLVGAAIEDCRNGIQRPRILVGAADTAAQRYGRDYDLGDIVTVRFDEEDLKVLVTALTFNLERGHPPTVTPTLGTEVAVAPLKLIQKVNGQAARLNQLERR